MEINTNAFVKNVLFTDIKSGEVFKLGSALYMKTNYYQISAVGQLMH